MKTYQKPETALVLPTSSKTVMQVIEGSPGSGNVDPEKPDDPNDPTLTNDNSIWDTWEDEK